MENRGNPGVHEKRPQRDMASPVEIGVSATGDNNDTPVSRHRIRPAAIHVEGNLMKRSTIHLVWITNAVTALVIALALGCRHESSLPLQVAPPMKIVSVHSLTDTTDLLKLKRDLGKFIDENHQFLPDEVASITALRKKIAAIRETDDDFYSEVDDARDAFESIKSRHEDVLARNWT